MAGEFRKLQNKKYPKLSLNKETAPDVKYWRKFEPPRIVKEYSSINYVDFSPVEPHNYAVTCAGKIQVFRASTNEVIKTSNRNKENVYGARFRQDGSLLVVGGESGLVQVLAVNNRSILRNLSGHTKATQVCCFSQEPSTIYSASDDKTVRIWDMSTSQEVSCIKAHKDYIRCGCISPVSENLFLTGSYDHYVKLWDAREGKAVVSMNHGLPVESVIMFRTGGVCYSAGGNYIKVWDILGGGRVLHQFSNHQKTITCLAMDGQHTRLLSGSLDRHVKVYDMQDCSVVANLDYPSPILSLGLSPAGSHLVAGMSDGAISIRRQPQSKVVKRVKHRPRPGTYKYFIRGTNAKPKENDVVIGAEKKPPQLKKVDRCLRKFRYHDALDAAFESDTSLHAPYIISVFHELARRNALQIALSNRDGTTLDKILNFLTKNISNPRYAEVCVQVSNLVLDLYTWKIGQDTNFAHKIQQLNMKIKSELRLQEQMMECLGVLDNFFAMASVNAGKVNEGEVLDFDDQDAFDPAELDVLEDPPTAKKDDGLVDVVAVVADEMVEHAERKKKEPQLIPQLIVSSAEKNKEPQLIVSSEDEGRLISSEDETKLIIVEEEEEKIVEVMDEDVVEVIDSDDKKQDGGEVLLVDHYKIHGEKDHDPIRNEEKDDDEKICPIDEHSEEVDDDSLVVLSDKNDDTIKIDDSPQSDIVMIDEKQVDIIPLEEKVDILTVIEEEKSLKKLTAIDIDDEEISFSIERKIDSSIDKSNDKDPLKELKMNGSSIKARSKRSRLRNGAVTEGEEISTTEDETMKDKGYNSSPGVAGRVKNRTKRRSTRKVNGGV